MDLLNFLDKIEKQRINIEKDIVELELKYWENDVRLTFFQKYQNIIRFYYTWFNSIFICNKLENPIVWNFSKEEILHIENYGLLSLKNIWHNEYISQLKLNFITNSWSCFESDIDIIFKNVFTLEQISKIKEKRKTNYRIIKQKKWDNWYLYK